MSAYAESLLYLYNLPSFQYWRTDTPVALPELSRVRGLLRRLGNPHHRFESVHVAGTKGKGTVSAVVASILHQAGVRTGLYTSPHLHTFRERIQVDGEMISEAEVTALTDWFQRSVRGPTGTTFEAITAIAFEHFRRKGVEVAVLEVGLGGRFDATNVVRPLVSVIASIGLDHLNILGATVPQIAHEKAGIIKQGVPVVFTPQKQAAATVLAEEARHKRARQVWVGRDWRWEREALTTEGQRFTIHTPDEMRVGWSSPLDGLFLPLLGRHQLDNATAAVAAVAEVARSGVAVPERAVREGLAKVHWPARLEVLQARPWLIVDAAHTVESIEASLAAVSETLGRLPDTVVFGASDDKDVAGMLRLMPPDSRFLFAQAPHPRAMPAERLQSVAQSRGLRSDASASVLDAVSAALAEAHEGGVILVVGSIFLAAAAREAWFSLRGLPPPPSDPG